MLRSMTVLQVRDVAASEAFYTELGFASHGTWGDPPSFCIVQRGDVTFALDAARDGEVPANQYWAAYVYVDDVDALFHEFSGLGVTILTKVRRDNPYGCDDFDIQDPDGHKIGFGQSRAPFPGPGLGEDRGRD